MFKNKKNSKVLEKNEFFFRDFFIAVILKSIINGECKKK
tara:strand:+ start:1155 stop:1271 length:117 start_codon:yes stop_codon:yes gene_type:complete